MHKLFVETVKEWGVYQPIISNVHEATEEDITRLTNSRGKELLIYGKPGYLYDLRFCHQPLGTV